MHMSPSLVHETTEVQLPPDNAKNHGVRQNKQGANVKTVERGPPHDVVKFISRLIVVRTLTISHLESSHQRT